MEDFAEVIKEDTNVLGVTRVPVEVVDPVEKVCNLIHHLLYLLHPILYPPPPSNVLFTGVLPVHNTGGGQE